MPPQARLCCCNFCVQDAAALTNSDGRTGFRRAGYVAGNTMRLGN